ncbi:MAG: signal peptidase I [Mucispirillum sp.]|nr:signal peptidase I [Mucispirillum sp.]
MSENEDKQSENVKQKSGFRETLDSIIVAFVIAMIIRAFFIGAYKIPTGSMLDTLQIGDHLLVNKLSYLFSDPKHDDIVVFEYPVEPNKDYIKRVIGVPGDEIRIENKIVYRNGEKLEPAYIKYENGIDGANDPHDNVETFVVPEDCYFMMGDNRDNSFDSRYWGFVKRDAIVGKALIIYWSWGDKGPRFNRILNLIK